MAKFCGKCGTKLDEATGLCPNCDAEKIKENFVQKEPMMIKKKENRADMTLKQKIKSFFIRLIGIVAGIALLLGIFFGILVYFDIVDIPVISTFMDITSIKRIPHLDSGYFQIEGKFTPIKVVDSDSAIAAAQEAAENSGLEKAANELSVVSINTIDGVTYYRLQQNYNGFPVYGRAFVVSADNEGNTQSLTTNGLNIKVNTSETILLDEAKLIIKDYLKKLTKSDNITVFNNFKEVIYSFDVVLPTFSYRFKALVDNELYDVFLGIEEKNVIACFNANMSQVVSGSGVDVTGKEASFDIKKHSDKLFSLEDTNRNIRVFDANNRTVTIGEDYIYVGDSKGNIYKSNGADWVDKYNNVVTVEENNGSLKQGNWIVIDHTGKIIDENAYCLVDIYGQNTKLSPVESNSANFTNSEAVTLMNEAQRIYDFFSQKLNRTGFDNNNGSMSLVANNTKGAYSSDIAKDNPAAMLAFGNDNVLSTELIAHEYMHSVEKSIVGMLYDGESGAIMEAYSDIFGEILEDYNDGNLNKTCDWIHHSYEEFGYNHSRNIRTPNDSGNPSKVGEDTRPIWLRFFIKKDEGHHCSTIISHAAYIMTTNQGDGTPLTMAELSNLLYRTLLTLPSNCTFSDLRESMILTASSSGFAKDKITRVSSAFSMAGIEGNNHSGKYSTDIRISVLDNTGKIYSNYSIDISGTYKSGWFGWTEKEFTAHHVVDNLGSLPITLNDNGNYKITVTDGSDSNKSYTKDIEVSGEHANKQITFMTDFGEQCDSKNSSDSYTWIVDPTIEADDIYYLADYPDPNQAINTVSEQANNPNAVIQRGEQLGIISLEGKLLADLEYKKIANFGDSYMMVRTIPKYSEEFDQDWEIYWLNQEGKVSADVGNGSFDSALYYYFEGVRQQTGYFPGRYVKEVMPVQESSICNPHDIKLVMNNLLGKYALEQNGNLITDFIYDECGSESDGLFAVCQNGKWGYIDKKGQVIIPIEYDASWSQYPVFDFGSSRSSDNVKEYCYAASDGYVVLRQDNQWELKDIIGNSIIPKGVFEAIRPVYEGKCWVKKNGKWGVIQIGNSKGTQKTEDTSIFASMPSEGRFSSGVGGWANNMKLRSDGAFTGVYYDFDLGLTGEGYPRGTAAICNFNGKFSMPEKIDDYTYRTKLKELMKDGVVGEEYIEDGTKYIYSDAFGLEGGENDFIIYTPGKPISELPEGFLSWVRMGSPVADAISNDTLSLYGIYNESLETAFLFYVGRTFNQSDLPADAVEFNGHYYQVYNIDDITNWNDAKAFCETQGGYLATITSQEENDFLFSYMKQEGYSSAYFGLSDSTNEGTWTWSNGEQLSYTNWHNNEPNEENSNEDYAMFYYKYPDGTWNDGDFGNRTVNSGTAFICEWG